MQEILPFVRVVRPHKLPEAKLIVSGIKWLAVAVWKPIRWLLEAMFVPHPGQKYIDESRVRAMRMIGHF